MGIFRRLRRRSSHATPTRWDMAGVTIQEAKFSADGSPRSNEIQSICTAQLKLRPFNIVLQDQPFVSNTARDAFAVEILKQGDCVLSRDSRQVFERDYIQLRCLCLLGDN